MCDLSEKLSIARSSLMFALGDNSQKYLNNMKFWFRHKWSQEEFDLECRKLLTPTTIRLHNEFLKALLNKIDTFSKPQQPISIQETNNSSNRSGRKRKRGSKFCGERSSFEPFDLWESLIEENLDMIRPPNSTDDNLPSEVPQRYCVQELFLPDAGFVMGRLLVGAWENGLVNVDDVVAEYLATAVHTLLKNIITAIILKRKHYKVTGEGAFYYDIGHPIKHPFLRNSVTRQKVDDTPLELDKEITSLQINIPRKNNDVLKMNNDDSVFLSSCEELYPQRKAIITIRDVYKALQDKNIIPSHSVYSINMERISQMLH